MCFLFSCYNCSNRNCSFLAPTARSSLTGLTTAASLMPSAPDGNPSVKNSVCCSSAHVGTCPFSANRIFFARSNPAVCSLVNVLSLLSAYWKHSDYEAQTVLLWWKHQVQTSHSESKSMHRERLRTSGPAVDGNHSSMCYWGFFYLSPQLPCATKEKIY